MTIGLNPDNRFFGGGQCGGMSTTDKRFRFCILQAAHFFVRAYEPTFLFLNFGPQNFGDCSE